MYVISKRGVYGHGVFGLTKSFEKSKWMCVECASNEVHDYYVYEVHKVALDVVFSGSYEQDSTGYINTKPLFTCTQSGQSDE